jgi:MFS family permease
MPPKIMKQKIINVYCVFVLLVISIFNFIDRSILSPNYNLIMAEFGITESQMGLVSTVFTITIAICTVFFGFLNDQVNRKLLLFFGGVQYSIFSIFIGFSTSYAWLLVLKILTGIGIGVILPVSYSLISDMFKNTSRGKVFSVFGLATTIGNALGVMLSGEFGSAGDWRTPFIIIGFMNLISAFFVLGIKTPKVGAKEEILENILSQEGMEYSYRIKKEDLKYIYTRKSNFWLIINFVDTIFSGLILGFLFVWLQMEVGINVNNLAPQIPILLPFALVIVLFLLWGQFWFARKGDQKVRGGDYAGRVKVAIFCGVTHIPFLMIGFLFYPDLSNFTFFIGGLDLSGNIWLFVLLLLLMGLIVGLGLGIEFGVGPAWFASMIDVNLPEHRGTMIAAASFMDAIGRGLGAYVGALIIDHYIDLGSIKPIGDTIVFCTFTFGVLSAVLWLPILKYAKHDFKQVSDVLKERAKVLEEQKNHRINTKDRENEDTSI